MDPPAEIFNTSKPRYKRLAALLVFAAGIAAGLANHFPIVNLAVGPSGASVIPFGHNGVRNMIQATLCKAASAAHPPPFPPQSDLQMDPLPNIFYNLTPSTAIALAQQLNHLARLAGLNLLDIGATILDTKANGIFRPNMRAHKLLHPHEFRLPMLAPQQQNAATCRCQPPLAC